MQRSSHSHRQHASRKRTSWRTLALLDLPVELRLLIFECCFPSVYDVTKCWPAPIPALLRTCRQINAETKEAMKNWSPIHYVPQPSDINVVPQPGVLRVETICLSMFHNAPLDVLRSGMRNSTPPQNLQASVYSWIDIVEQLPLHSSIRTIMIDATPAPGWMRYGKPQWVANLVNDRSVASTFIFEHITSIAELMVGISRFYKRFNLPIGIELAGDYGMRSESFPSLVIGLAGTGNITPTFTGDFVSVTPRRGPVMTIRYGINEIYSRHSSIDRYGRLDAQTADARHQLKKYNFRPASEFLFDNCLHDNDYWTMHQLEKLTTFAVTSDDSPRYVDVKIPDFGRGAFICSLARDLDLNTSPRSDWRARKIRVTRMRRPNRTKSQLSAATSSFVDMVVWPAIVMALVMVVSYREPTSRRR